MTATAHATGGTAASTGRLPSVASGVLELVWPMYVTLVLTLGAWVVVPTLVLGWQPITIISGSMAPAVQPGHVVVVEPYDGRPLGPGTVVTFRDAGADRLVTHRIVAVAEDGTITTRGDANAVDDPTPLTTDRIVGVGRLVVPAAGLPALWAHEGRHDLLLGLGVLTVIAGTAAAGAASDAARAVRRRLSHRPRAGGGRVRTVGLTAAVLGVVAIVGATAISRAAFVGADDNPSNAFAAASLVAPSDLTATRGCVLLGLLAPHVTVSWTGAPGTPGYEVFRSTSRDSGYTSLAVTTDRSYVDAAVILGTTYHYRVRSVGGTWTSPTAGPASASIPLLCT